MKTAAQIILLLVYLLMGVASEAARPYEPVRPDPLLEPWRWRSFPELKGLGLQCMAEDRDGRMWFGVDGGVRCYDGFAWTAYTPADGLLGAPVNCLCVAQDGSVYAGTEAGISRFVDGAWQRVFPPEGDVPWPVFDLLEISDGSVWAGTPWGALRLSADGVTLYTVAAYADPLKILAPGLPLIFVPDGLLPEPIWLGEGIGVWLIQGEGWRSALHLGTLPAVVGRVYSDTPAEAAGLRVGDRILAVDGQAGHLRGLYGTPGTPVRLTVRREGQAEPIEMAVQRARFRRPTRGFTIFDIFEDQSGAMWFGLLGGPILRYDPQKGAPEDIAAWRYYTDADGMAADAWPSICQTRDGTVWTWSSTRGEVVNRFDGQVWTRVPLAAGSNINIITNRALLETQDGTLWVCGVSRLHAFRNGVWRMYSHADVSVMSGRIRNLMETSDGALWLITGSQAPVRLDYGISGWATYAGLHFQCETPDGSRWFVARESAVVRFDGQNWARLGVEDGLMDHPAGLTVTRKGVLWASGSHGGTAATARLDGTRWTRWTHPELARNIQPKSVFEAWDGSLWFSAWGFDKALGQRGGILQFDPSREVWIHHTPPEAPSGSYGIGQSRDGALWFGGAFRPVGLRRFDGLRWTGPDGPKELTSANDAIYTAPSGDLWVGTRSYGAFCYDGNTWTHHDVRNGLAGNSVRDIVQTNDGSMWVITAEGVSRFDGQTWTTQALPQALPVNRYMVIGQSRDGALWINLSDQENGWQTVRYVPDAHSPNTQIVSALEEVAQPGHTLLSWDGADFGGDTPHEALHYAWRLDGGDWSHFSHAKSHMFRSLPAGAHTFEVRARDRDFNVDATPATVAFTVIPPVWQQAWFIGLVAVFLGVAGFQSVRLVRRGRRLAASNAALRGEMAARANLDAQLRELRYLYRLRVALGDARSVEEGIQNAGNVLSDALSVSGGGAIVQHDGRAWPFGAPEREGQTRYERPLVWGGKDRGQLVLFSNVNLSETQERALLDETAGQLAAALEARELELQLLRSSRLVALGETVAGVAHELTQPLMVVSTAAGDILDRVIEGVPLPQEKLKAAMQDVLEMVSDMDATVDHLRVFSRDMSNEPGTPFSVNEAVQDSLKLIGTQLENHGIALRLDLAEPLPPVYGHPRQMAEVFLNLIGNARDALDDRDGSDEKWIAIRSECDGEGRVVAEVADSGAGIAAADLARIFDPFFTTKPAGRGTGLGLSIAYAIVRDHGGEISCKSTQGEGTVFQMQLPSVGEA